MNQGIQSNTEKPLITNADIINRILDKQESSDRMVIDLVQQIGSIKEEISALKIRASIFGMLGGGLTVAIGLGAYLLQKMPEKTLDMIVNNLHILISIW